MNVSIKKSIDAELSVEKDKDSEQGETPQAGSSSSSFN